MKRILGILFLILVMFTTVCFAAFPAELEGEETEEGLENFGTLDTKNDNENVNYDYLVMPISEDENTEKQENMILDDVYKIEESVIIDYDIDGNAYILAEEVTIENVIINGNLYVLAKKIDISNSQINGSIYALGEKFEFSGITQDIYACGAEVTIGDKATVVRNLKVASDILNINGNIQRNVDAGIDELNIASTAKINGKLNYYSEKKGEISQQAQINEIVFTQETVEEADVKEENIASDIISGILTFALKALVVALVIFFGTTKFNELKRTENFAGDYVKASAKGIGFLVLVPLIAIILICTVIGVGFGFVVLALYIIALYIAVPLFCIETSKRIFDKKEKSDKKLQIIGVAVLISAIIGALKFVPVLGGILKFIVILIGLGIIVNLMFEKTSKEVVNEN